MPRHLLCIASFVLALASPAIAQQAQQADVTDRVVVTGMIPVPNVGEGAPYHSVEEIKEMDAQAQRDTATAIAKARVASKTVTCAVPFDTSVMHRQRPGSIEPRRPGSPLTLEELYNNEKARARTVSQLATKAEEATRRADDSRRSATAADMKTIEKLELARQAEVKKLEKARFELLQAQAAIADYGDLVMRGRRTNIDPTLDAGSKIRAMNMNTYQDVTRADLDLIAAKRQQSGWGMGIPRSGVVAGLSIANIRVAEQHDDKGAFLRITGEVRNDGDTPAASPGLVVSFLDERGLVLGKAPAASPGKPPAHGSLPFDYQLRPSPAHVAKALVSFATGYEPPPEISASLLCPQDAPN